MKSFSNSSQGRRLYRPPDYSRRRATAAEWFEAAVGLALFFAVLYAWREASGRLPAVGEWTTRAMWQAACVAAGAAVLLAIDGLARWRWGWDRMRMGMLMGAFAAAGFWMMRLIIWGGVYWLGGGGPAAVR